MMGTLLHNMSIPAKTTITHDAPEYRVYGHGIVIGLPTCVLTTGAIELLDALGCSPRSRDTADLELRAKIEAHALALPLPAAVAVDGQSRNGDTECTDLLTIITILAKSSSRVYLRDKEPNLSSIVAGRRLILLLPRKVML